MALPDYKPSHYTEFARALQSKNIVRAAEILVNYGAFSHGVSCAISLLNEFVETNQSPTHGVGKDSFPRAIARLKQASTSHKQSNAPSTAFPSRK